jgi:hypothetical protein
VQVFLAVLPNANNSAFLFVSLCFVSRIFLEAKVQLFWVMVLNRSCPYKVSLQLEACWLVGYQKWILTSFRLLFDTSYCCRTTSRAALNGFTLSLCRESHLFTASGICKLCFVRCFKTQQYCEFVKTQQQCECEQQNQVSKESQRVFTSLDLRFSQWWPWRIISLGMCRCVVW